MSALVIPPKINQQMPQQQQAAKKPPTLNVPQKKKIKQEPNSVTTTDSSTNNFGTAIENSENKVQQLIDQLSKMKPLKSNSIKKPISVKYLDIKTVAKSKFSQPQQNIEKIEEEEDGSVYYKEQGSNNTNNSMDIEQNVSFDKNLQFEKLYGTDYDKFVASEELSLENSLKNSKVSDEMRSRMVDWIIEVFANYYETTSEETFFKTVLLMDAYIKYSQDKTVEDQDIHLVGIACMFIASKYEDIYHIPLKDFVERISHNKFLEEDIKQKEYEVMKAVKFKLSQPTSLRMLRRFIFKSFKSEKSPILKNINISAIYMLKMCLHDHQFQNYKPQILALSALIFTIKTLFFEFYETKPQNKKELLAQENYLISGILSTPIDQIDNKEVEKCMIKMQNLFTTFPKKYPNLQNLKKFCNF